MIVFTNKTPTQNQAIIAVCPAKIAAKGWSNKVD